MDSRKQDLRPEYCHYRDGGCEFAPYCLNCPFPRCIIEEIPRGRQRHKKELRNKDILTLFYAQGESIKQIAQRFGVSQRTIQRALKRAEKIGGSPC